MVTTWEFRFIGRNAKVHAVLFTDTVKRELPEAAAKHYSSTSPTHFYVRASLTPEQADDYARALRREYASFQRYNRIGA